MLLPFNKIRVIRFKRHTGPINMALDYYLSTTIKPDSVPVLRFYGWDPYCLSIGKHQTTSNINFHKLANDGYDIVRRPTGGSAILHSEELTYSITVPVDLMTHHELYEKMHVILGNTLNQLGYNVELHEVRDNSNYLKEGSATFACFNRPAYMEIKFRDRKLVGSAQKIYPNSILQHGSILIGQKQKEIVRYLKESKQKLKATVQYLNKNSVCLNEISDRKINETDLADAIIRSIENLGVKIVGDQIVNDIELSQAKKYIDGFKVKNAYQK